MGRIIFTMFNDETNFFKHFNIFHSIILMPCSRNCRCFVHKRCHADHAFFVLVLVASGPILALEALPQRWVSLGGARAARLSPREFSESEHPEKNRTMFPSYLKEPEEHSCNCAYAYVCIYRICTWYVWSEWNMYTYVPLQTWSVWMYTVPYIIAYI